MKFLKKWKIVLFSVLALMLTGCTVVCAAAPVEEEKAEAVCYMDTLPGNWSAQSDQTPEKEYLRSLTTTPLYAAAEGELLPGLAELPADVTGEYAGNELYGIPAGAQRGYAFRITLREDAFWEDGKAVTADDVLFTLETLLEEHLWLANAQPYLDGMEKTTQSVISLGEAGFETLAEAEEAGYSRFYLDLANFWGLEAGWESIGSRVRIMDYAMPTGLNELYVTPAYLYGSYLAEGMSLSYLQNEFIGVAQSREVLTFADVGVLKAGEYEILVVTGEPTAAQTVAARLEGLCLLRRELYGEDYGASPESYSSYGPYRIVSTNAEEIRLERNEFWTGDRAEYPADVIRCLSR